MSFISEQGTLEKERKVVSTSMPELSKWMQSALKAILNLFWPSVSFSISPENFRKPPLKMRFSNGGLVMAKIV